MIGTFKRPIRPCNRPPCSTRPTCFCAPLPPLPEPCCNPCCEPCCEPPRCCEPSRCCEPPRCCTPTPCRPLPSAQICGRESQRCLSARLRVTGLPRGACGPWTLAGLETSCEEPCVRVRRNCRGPSSFVAEVTVPLTAWVCDANGCRHAGNTEVVICVRISDACGCGPGSLMASADVRLQDPGCPSPCLTFDVRLAVFAEVFRIWVGSCGRERGNECRFDSRPMFPQPWW